MCPWAGHLNSEASVSSLLKQTDVVAENADLHKACRIQYMPKCICHRSGTPGNCACHSEVLSECTPARISSNTAPEAARRERSWLYLSLGGREYTCSRYFPSTHCKPPDFRRPPDISTTDSMREVPFRPWNPEYRQHHLLAN